MAVFRYQATDSQGKRVSGLVEATSADVAAKLLHDKQLFVMTLKAGGNSISNLTGLAKYKGVSLEDVTNFTRQLSTMVTAGLSLPESLSILRKQTTNPILSEVLSEVEHQIVGGSNLADSLARFPKYFSPIFISLVRAGESSGTLDQVLNRLAETLEDQREFRSKVKGALIYPVIIVIGMIGVVMVMMTVVVPKLTEMYRDFGISLPASTRLLMDISGFFVNFWWLVIIGGAGGVWAFGAWRKTPSGELIVDGLILKIPLFGELQKKVILVEFTRTLGMLISSGIHILDGLRILKDSLGNVLYREAVADITKKVEKGFPLGETFAQYPVFPPIVSQMIKVGEETGKLDDTLKKLANYFQTESEHLVKGLTTAIEPIIMVFLGIGVGFIVISVITPIYSLTSQFK